METEAGYTENESVTYAVRKVIEQSVIELIKEGEKQGLWGFKAEDIKDKYDPFGYGKNKENKK